MMKAIVLENGRRIEIDDTPHYIGEDKVLYVFMPNGYGYSYAPIGKVKEIIDEEEEEE